VGKDINNKRDKKDEQRQELLSLGMRSASSDELDAMPSTDHDENMEATRLILIQYRVVNGSISTNDAAVVLAPHPGRNAKPTGKGTMMHFGKEFPEIDAADIVGCGVLPQAILPRKWI
jgi:hypothetical protein